MGSRTVKEDKVFIICPKCFGSGQESVRVTLYDSDTRACTYCKGHRVILETTTMTHEEIVEEYKITTVNRAATGKSPKEIINYSEEEKKKH